MLESLWIVVLVVLLLVIAYRTMRIKQVIVYEYQRGLKYSKGRYAGTLDPGQYWILSSFSSIVAVDVSPEFITIQGQDVLSSDGFTLNVILAGYFQFAYPNVAINNNANFRTAFYLSFQMALREIVGK